MKKISVTLWIVLAGIIIYIGSLWQRPLFLFEYAEFEEAVNCLLKNSTPHYSSWLNIIPLKLFGLKAFSARLVPALLTLAAGIFIFLAGKKSNFPNAGKAGALIFLLSPAVFLAGTTSIHPMYAAAPAITGACSLFLLTGSRDRLNGILWGISGTISMCLLLVEGSVYLFILLLILQVVFAVLRRFVIEPENKNTLFSMLSFIPFVIAGLWGSRHAAAGAFQLPDWNSIKILAAVIGAGFFPWLYFIFPVSKNFTSRIKNICSDNYTCFALLLSTVGTVAALLLPLTSGAVIIALAGFAILLGAGLEMECVENGFRSCNIILYIVAAIFILLALATGILCGLGAWTKLLPAQWKIFSAGETWGLNVLVPVVTAVWCFTAAGEKFSKYWKFLAFCAGIAFFLFASHGIMPQKIVMKNAPEFFIRQVVLPRVSDSIILKADRACRIPLQAAFLKQQVEYFDFSTGVGDLKKEIRQGRKFCIMLASRQTANKLPFPKTVISSGSFCAVFYNIDFPEMRKRKP